MPRLPTDFSKNVNYMLVCKDINVTDKYVGHTTNFTNRKSGHKYDCNNPNGKNYNLKVYQFIRANGGFENWSMIQLEVFPCKDIFEATRQERIWCEKLKATLNSHVPSQTYQEYYQNNMKQISEQKKKYYQNNKEHFSEYYENNKEQRNEKINCICGSTCIKVNIKRHEKTNKHIKFLEQQK